MQRATHARLHHLHAEYVIARDNGARSQNEVDDRFRDRLLAIALVEFTEYFGSETVTCQLQGRSVQLAAPNLAELHASKEALMVALRTWRPDKESFQELAHGVRDQLLALEHVLERKMSELRGEDAARADRAGRDVDPDVLTFEEFLRRAQA